MALFVGRLSVDVRQRDLEDIFAKYGKLQRCDMKGTYAFVTFEDERDAEDAVKECNSMELMGNRINVEWAKGGGGRGSGGGSGCFQCGKEGHIARDCPERQDERRGDRRDRGGWNADHGRDRGSGRDRGYDDHRGYGRDDRDDRRDYGRGDRRDYGRGDHRDYRKDDRRDYGRDDRRDYGRGDHRDGRRDYGRDEGREDRRDVGRESRPSQGVRDGPPSRDVGRERDNHSPVQPVRDELPARLAWEDAPTETDAGDRKRSPPRGDVPSPKRARRDDSFR